MDTMDRMIATMRSSFGSMGRWIDPPGALVSPRAPGRALLNSVVPVPGAQLRLSELAAAYRDADVHAWTVWIPEGDPRAAELEAGGHVLDASPSAMVVPLDGWEPPPEPEADWTAQATAEEMGAVNEASYPWKDGTLAAAYGGADASRFRFYAVRENGVAVCVLGIHDHEGDAGVYFVATHPDARGRGYGGALLGRALVDARERGCDVSTLQATRMGESVYARIGYQRFGAMEMWERRT